MKIMDMSPSSKKVPTLCLQILIHPSNRDRVIGNPKNSISMSMKKIITSNEDEDKKIEKLREILDNTDEISGISAVTSFLKELGYASLEAPENEKSDFRKFIEKSTGISLSDYIADGYFLDLNKARSLFKK
jgi:lipopolysaccharide biosynthesis regulator YciM